MCQFRTIIPTQLHRTSHLACYSEAPYISRLEDNICTYFLSHFVTLACDYVRDECSGFVIAIIIFLLVRQKYASTSEQETRRAPLHRVKELRRQSRARVKQPAFPVRARIVPDHYSLGLLFKDVARTCLGIMLARARGTQSDASTDRRGFYALEMVLTPFCAEE